MGEDPLVREIDFDQALGITPAHGGSARKSGGRHLEEAVFAAGSISRFVPRIQQQNSRILEILDVSRHQMQAMA
jgi:hypothetical protein